MKIGDLVMSSFHGPGLILQMHPTIGTSIKMVEVFWGPEKEHGLYSEKSISVINEATNENR